MMKSFMELAKSNTDKNLETCGILAGLLVSDFTYFLELEATSKDRSKISLGPINSILVSICIKCCSS